MTLNSNFDAPSGHAHQPLNHSAHYQEQGLNGKLDYQSVYNQINFNAPVDRTVHDIGRETIVRDRLPDAAGNQQGDLAANKNMLNDSGFLKVTLEASEQILFSFNGLVLDPYCGGKFRYRRFSQYRLSYTSSWSLQLLPHRPFVQSRSYNHLVGGILRSFEPLICDPTEPVQALADCLGLNHLQDWQINVHQIRTVCDETGAGVVVPEGPHRDGYTYVALWVVRRNDIFGGETTLLPLDSDEPFLRNTIQPGEALLFDDRIMRHHTTDIHSNGQGACRESFIVVFNPWEERKYGELHETAATL